ncbi:MAG: molecular chaperone GrpE, partial [Gammaproteobacteria bacterium]
MVLLRIFYSPELVLSMSSNEIDPEQGKKDDLSSGEAREATEAEMAETMVLQEDGIESVADEYAETTVLDEAGSMAEELRAALEQAQQQLQTYQYAVAEAENKVRRVEREAQQVRQFAVERFAGDMLAVLDTLEL